jgi:hydrogenase maturation protein HypF
MGICKRLRIRVDGTVQGVGFRPFVYRLAVDRGITGFVLNGPCGVEIEAQGEEKNLSAFMAAIARDAPPLAKIDGMTSEEIPTSDDGAFTIRESVSDSRANTTISPDIAPCDDCLRELSDPADRRRLYPFINCTNCGPRFTIIEALPYDRKNTTMKKFAMCDACGREYEDPLDRRFHAEPTACPVCGPKLTFMCGSRSIEEDAIGHALKSLAFGGIVAIKGIGGYHLACDARSEEAVSRLRRHKRRDEKPFAIMAGDIESAKRLCEISDAEVKLLTSPERPIVLLRQREKAGISALVAPGNKKFGLMLPSSPLHHMLFTSPIHQPIEDSIGAFDQEDRVFVMTSGNVTDEPLAYKDDEACLKLSGIADAFLMHDREIHMRVDDSITRISGDAPQIIRRARGYAPSPIMLRADAPEILAAGADLKGAICLTKGRRAYLSQHLGDLSNHEAAEAFSHAARHLMDTLQIKPDIVVHDMHPDYISSIAAKKFARAGNIRRTCEVQHHHAHILSVMAEHGLDDSVIGIALDGTGFGPDGTVWGGEIVAADFGGFTRMASLRPVPMPGGDAAARKPWRMAISYLASAGREDIAGKILKATGDAKIATALSMMDKGINCPLTSSTGRLFDAVAAITGVRLVNSFEGQTAMELEQSAYTSETSAYEFDIVDGKAAGPFAPRYIISFDKMIHRLASDTIDGVPPGTMSMRFHNTFVSAIEKATMRISSDTGIRRVCLSGGCFQNDILNRTLVQRFKGEGLEVYTNMLAPPNDGGIALGQAVYAAHRFS